MSEDVFAGYLSEEEIAAQRGKSTRTLRAERQAGVGPPYVRDGRSVLYPVEGFRAWLQASERLPVRTETFERSEKQVARTDRAPALKPRGAPAGQTGRRRALEETA